MKLLLYTYILSAIIISISAAEINKNNFNRNSLDLKKD